MELVTNRLPSEEDGNNLGNVLALSAVYLDLWEVLSVDFYVKYSQCYLGWVPIKGLDPRPYVKQTSWWATESLKG